MKYINGDLFKSNADVIAHQVNCKGKMCSGVAKQVKELYPEAFDEYEYMCCEHGFDADSLLGSVCDVKTDSGVIIANLFAQNCYGYDGGKYTDYDAMRNALHTMNEKYAGKTVAIPYLMGCDRGGGSWSVVSKIVEDELKDCSVEVYKLNK